MKSQQTKGCYRTSSPLCLNQIKEQTRLMYLPLPILICTTKLSINSSPSLSMWIFTAKLLNPWGKYYLLPIIDNSSFGRGKKLKFWFCTVERLELREAPRSTVCAISWYEEASGTRSFVLGEGKYYIVAATMAPPDDGDERTVLREHNIMSDSAFHQDGEGNVLAYWNVRFVVTESELGTNRGFLVN